MAKTIKFKAKSKRQKRQNSKKAASQAPPKSGNPTGVTWTETKKGSEKSQSQKTEGKDGSKKRPKHYPKVIIGFGSKTGAKNPVVHAICALHNSAICDTRIKGLPVMDELSIKEVTCKKCQGYSVFKQLVVKELSEDKPESETGKSTSPKDDIRDPQQQAKEKDEEAEESPESKSSNDIDSMFETLKEMIFYRLTKMEKRVMKKLEAFCVDLVKAKPDFYITRKANNMFQIIHDSSRYVIIENIKESQAEELLPKFLAIQVEWDGKTEPSNDWMTEIRKVNEQIRTKKKDRSIKRRPRPSIKKRKDRKETRRTIKRRQK